MCLSAKSSCLGRILSICLEEAAADVLRARARILHWSFQTTRLLSLRWLHGALGPTDLAKKIPQDLAQLCISRPLRETNLRGKWWSPLLLWLSAVFPPPWLRCGARSRVCQLLQTAEFIQLHGCTSAGQSARGGGVTQWRAPVKQLLNFHTCAEPEEDTAPRCRSAGPSGITLSYKVQASDFNRRQGDKGVLGDNVRARDTVQSDTRASCAFTWWFVTVLLKGLKPLNRLVQKQWVGLLLRWIPPTEVGARVCGTDDPRTRTWGPTPPAWTSGNDTHTHTRVRCLHLSQCQHLSEDCCKLTQSVLNPWMKQILILLLNILYSHFKAFCSLG